MKRINTVADEYARFAEAIVPRDAPEVQQTAMRDCFYAGALSMLGLTKELGEDSWSEDDGAAQLESWAKELNSFVESIEAREAS